MASAWFRTARIPIPGSFDVLGAVLSTSGLVALVYAIIEAPAEGWDNPLVLPSVAVSAVVLLMFVIWERHTSEPMLNLGFFSNPRYAIGSFAIALAFFSLFGAIFGVTQFLQLAHGYSPLRAGAAMLPLACGLVIGAGTSARLVARLGTANVVASGLAALGTILATAWLWTPGMSYWPLGFWFFGGAIAMGWVMAPATDSVMGAVPLEKAGVASAMNDVARQVAGALGTAIIGSLITALYSRQINGELPELFQGARRDASASVGAAHDLADRLPAAQGAQVIESAADAYTYALGVGLTAAAVIAIAAAVVVKRRLPSPPAPNRSTGSPIALETS